VTASVAIGSVPAVLVGSFLSSRAPDRYIRPVITYVIFASGLKYVGVPTTALGVTLAAVAAGGLTFWLVRAQPWRRGLPAAASAAGSASARAASSPPAGLPATDGAAHRGAGSDGQAQAPISVTVPRDGPGIPRENQSPPSAGLD
jgi:hypothetical protein